VTNLAKWFDESCASNAAPLGALELSPALQRWGYRKDRPSLGGTTDSLKQPGKVPLSGLRILVGRARHQASALSSGLKALGAAVIEIPFIEIRKPSSYKPLDSALNKIDKYDWLILTSINGVDALAARMKKLQTNPSALSHLQIAAIGPATRAQIENLGLKVAVVPDQYVAESVVKSLRRKMKGKRVLLARAKVARDVIPRELRRLGAKVDIVEAYETIVPRSSRKSLQKLVIDPKRRPHIVCFTSSSTVRNFALLLGMEPFRSGTSGNDVLPIQPRSGARIQPRALALGKSGSQLAPKGRKSSLSGLRFASIGPITSSTLREFGLPVHIEAKEYTIPGLIRAIVNADR
jgi:uroporphyrinogen-III synthase